MKVALAIATTNPMSTSVLTRTILASVSPITPEAGLRLSRAKRISSTKAARAQLIRRSMLAATIPRSTSVLTPTILASVSLILKGPEL